MKKLALVGLLFWSSVQVFASQVRMTLEVPAFHELSLSHNYTVFLRRGTAQEVVVIGPEETLQHLKATVDDGELSFDMDSRHFWENINSDEIRIFITVVQLTSIDVSGAVTLESKNRLESSNLSIEVSGAAEVQLELDVVHLDIELSGAANLELSGISRSADIEVSGASDLEAKDLITRRMELDCSGASNASVYVTDELDIEASGASDVSYRGNPNVHKEASFSSSISHID